jgi:hypothetical protein
MDTPFYHKLTCSKCDKPLKSFTSAKRTNRNYKERPLHLKCWKEEQKDTFLKSITKSF